MEMAIVLLLLLPTVNFIQLNYLLVQDKLLSVRLQQLEEKELQLASSLLALEIVKYANCSSHVDLGNFNLTNMVAVVEHELPIKFLKVEVSLLNVTDVGEVVLIASKEYEASSTRGGAMGSISIVPLGFGLLLKVTCEGALLERR